MTDISPLRSNSGGITFRAEDRARRAIDTAMNVEPSVLQTIFTRFDADRIMSEARALDGDAKRRAGPLAGIMVSIKDLFDEKGQGTSAQPALWQSGKYLRSCPDFRRLNLWRCIIGCPGHRRCRTGIGYRRIGSYSRSAQRIVRL